MATATLALSQSTALPDGGWRGDDFPTWLSPMLVRELRQGVQSGVFFWTFVVFQAVLYIVFSTQVLSSSSDARGSTAFFWLATTVAVAVIVPLRGLGAISSERVGNNIDLLMLTRQSATRVVLGKWIALIAQSAIIAVTLLPYCVIRYFFGGVDVVAELEAVGWILAVAAVVAAAAIAVSTLPFGGIGGGILAACFQASGFLLFEDEFVSGLWWLAPASKLGILVSLAVYTIAFLEFAAARIAPDAENHAARKRLFAITLAAAWAIAGWVGDVSAAEATFAVTAPLLLCYAVGAMLDRPSRVRALFLPFRRAGVVGRVAAMVLVPGWASGLVFLAVIIAACATGVATYFTHASRLDEAPVAAAFASLVVAAIVFPLPVTMRLPRQTHPMLVYFLIHLFCFCAFAFANAFKGDAISWGDYDTGQWVTMPLPIGALCSLFAAGGTASQVKLEGILASYTLAGLAVIGVVLAVVARPWLRELAAVGRFIRDDDHRGLHRGADASAVRREAAVRPWSWRGDDFPTWLPPMLVRELRQGVQSGVFAWTFIAIQATMFLLTAWAVGAFDPNGRTGNSEGVTRLFWLAIGVTIVGVIPLRGLTAVSGERVGNNLDLVRLSRMSATQIILGKWFAIIGQGVLVATAILPYLVVRYFLGGVNIVADLQVFGWLAVASLAVASAALALSTWSVLMRCVIVAAVFFGVMPMMNMLGYFLDEGYFFGGSRSTGEVWLAWVGIGAIALYTVAFLEYAAARIAPPAENHALRKRLLALGIAVTWAVLGATGIDEVFLATVFVTMPLLLTLGIEALLEEPRTIVALYRPFRRRGIIGRWAAMVFTPGWATGIPFILLASAVCMTGWFVFLFSLRVIDTDPIEMCLVAMTIGCLVVATLLFPLPFLVWFPRARPRLLLYALVQFACFMVFIYLASTSYSAMHDSSAAWLLTLPFPAASLPAYLRLGSSSGFLPMSVVYCVAAVGTTAVVLSSVRTPWLREYVSTMKAVRRGGRHAAS